MLEFVQALFYTVLGLIVIILLARFIAALRMRIFHRSICNKESHHWINRIDADLTEELQSNRPKSNRERK